ncbi:hypothetical protein [Pontimicrobium sp. IMCC45349]|uniref:hypothetical protein n=1 Tax=Pontimicrobium sp. IMCC45349 TaxID=3391574 RepID=UPI0039A1215E
MKYILILWCVFSFIACSPDNKTSLEPLKKIDIDNIPYLMYDNQIDLAYEIIAKGKVAALEVGDTMYYYNRINDNQIESKLRSIMCCSFMNTYDSLGFLSNYEMFTDYVENYTYKRIRVEDTIFESSLESSKKTKYLIKDERIIEEVRFIENDSNAIKHIRYIYNDEDRLEKVFTTIKKGYNNEFIHDKELKVYTYVNDSILFCSDFYQIRDIDTICRETIKYNNIGFPKEKRILFREDTLKTYFVMIKD